MALSPSGSNHQQQAVSALTERQRVRCRERKRQIAGQIHIWQACMWEGVWVSVCICAICFCLPFLCLRLCQSWNFMAGDYQRWFGVQSWIISFCVWYKHLGTCVSLCVWVCVSGCSTCLCTPQISLLKYFVSHLFSFQWINEHKGLNSMKQSPAMHQGLKSVCSHPLKPSSSRLWPDIIPDLLNTSG